MIFFFSKIQQEAEKLNTWFFVWKPQNIERDGFVRSAFTWNVKGAHTRESFTLHFQHFHTPWPRHGETIVIIVSKSIILKVGFHMQIGIQANPICIWNPVQQYDWNLLFKSVIRNSYIFCFHKDPQIFYKFCFFLRQVTKKHLEVEYTGH